MAIYRKSTVQPFVDDLDTYYQKLRAEVIGKAPEAWKSVDYHETEESFLQHYTDIDQKQLEGHLEYFRTAASLLKKLLKKDKLAPKMLDK
ncbi:MAG TPA: hypothetical protein ENK35_03090 [Candidatus Tenderia sp.]|nr:hypothetical protein [Candidatus Tenderia sp.]